jgi:hypothetical protein
LADNRRGLVETGVIDSKRDDRTLEQEMPWLALNPQKSSGCNDIININLRVIAKEHRVTDTVNEKPHPICNC